MTNLIGEQVILKTALMTGVVVAKGKKGPSYYVVKVWDTDAKKFEDIEEHELYMETIQNPLLLQSMNTDDREGLNRAYDLMTDMALDAGDAEWFNAIQVERNKPRRPVEASMIENNRVKVGRMVVDNNGTNSGIVVRENFHKKNTFQVKVWSNEVKDYVELTRHASALKVVQVPSWNKTPNRSDKHTEESTRQAFIEIAMALGNYEWLKELTKQEVQESDGA